MAERKAFPFQIKETQDSHGIMDNGMSLNEYRRTAYKAAALQGLLAMGGHQKNVATIAAKMADEMLAEDIQKDRGE